MLDTTVIYPFLYAVISVAVIGVAVAVGMLFRQSRTTRRATQSAPALDWAAAVTGQNVALNVNSSDRKRA